MLLEERGGFIGRMGAEVLEGCGDHLTNLLSRRRGAGSARCSVPRVEGRAILSLLAPGSRLRTPGRVWRQAAGLEPDQAGSLKLGARSHRLQR
jgi:hypothetical protein